MQLCSDGHEEIAFEGTKWHTTCPACEARDTLQKQVKELEDKVSELEGKVSELESELEGGAE